MRIVKRWWSFQTAFVLFGMNGGAAADLQVPANVRVVIQGFVSPTGTASNPGTVEAPWSLSGALSKAGRGSIITLLPGTYPSIVIRTPDLTLRSHEKWGAKISGSSGAHGITVNATNVVIDGIEISKSYMDGVKLNYGGNTIRNCWIHHSGRGNPNAVANSDASYTGQGIYAGCHARNTIEFNLIEHNGLWNSHDHGIYIAGTNHIIRGNVLRRNWAYGLQLYTGYAGESCSGIQVYNNVIYGNGVGGNGENCLTVWAGPPGTITKTTNYVFNNTLATGPYYPVICNGGYLGLTNNIILGSYDGSVIAVNGGTIWCDYNLFTNALRVRTGLVDGGHNLRVSNPGVVNVSRGLFWLTSTSPARGAALKPLVPPVDFFGKRQVAITDMGAFQYDAVLAADTRVLDPSPPKPDYWSDL